MKEQNNAYVGIALLLLCGIGLYGILTTSIPITDELVGPLALPWLSLAGCAFCASLLLIRSFCAKKQKNIHKDIKPIIKTISYFMFFALYLISMIFIGNYATLLNISYGGGFTIASLIFLTISMYILGQKTWYKVFAGAVMVVIICLLSFGHFFNIMLP